MRLTVDTEPGLIYRNNIIILDKQRVYEDSKIPGDERTMILIQTIANSIDKQIKVTFDVPSTHKDGYVPILDLKVKLNNDTKHQIEYNSIKNLW